jgi:SAM-dependent methyltransferase
VLDAAAGSAPNRDCFADVTYETADGATPEKDDSHIDHRCDLVDLPMPDSTYDLVWCSQTLAHVREPTRALAEFHRVLKPGGEAWITAPFYYAEHEVPWDFYRFSRFAWRHFADVIGFEVVELDWLEGYYGTLAYSLGMAARQL